MIAVVVLEDDNNDDDGGGGDKVFNSSHEEYDEVVDVVDNALLSTALRVEGAAAGFVKHFGLGL